MQQYTCPICSAVVAGSENNKYLCHVCDDPIHLIKSSNGRMIFDSGVWSGDDEYVMKNPFTCYDFNWITGKDIFVKHTMRKVKGVERFMHGEPWKEGEHIVLHFEKVLEVF